MNRPHPLLVVGYDGSAAATAAVSIALDRSGPAGHLIIVRAYDVPRVPHDELSYGDRLEDAADEAAHSIVELVNSEPRFAFADWERIVAIGEPAELLVRIAAEREADAILLGSRGLDRFDAIRGSVAHDVLHRADRPVTIVPMRMVAAM